MHALVIQIAANRIEWKSGNEQFFIPLQGPKDNKVSKDKGKDPMKSHQAVQLTYSNGAVTNISVNITEELGKTSIWRQLTESNGFEVKSLP